jgi:tetratricopeptide (TPR) repeat protein
MSTEKTTILQTPEEQQAFVDQAISEAEGLRKKKEYKEGIALLVEALRYGIRKEAIYYRLGNIYIDGDDLGRAEYAYKRALEMDPHHANAMHNLAVVYKRQRKISLFVKTYKKSQRIELRHPRKSDLSAEQKRHLRFLSLKILLWVVGGGAIIALVLFILLR